MGTQTTAKETPVCLFRCTLPECGAPDTLGGGEKQVTAMDRPSPGLWKLVSLRKRPLHGVGEGKEERLLSEERGGGALGETVCLCGALRGRQALIGATGQFQEKIQQLMTRRGAHGLGQKPELETETMFSYVSFCAAVGPVS